MDKVVQEGLFERSEYRDNHSDIDSYNPDDYP